MEYGVGLYRSINSIQLGVEYGVELYRFIKSILLGMGWDREDM